MTKCERGMTFFPLLLLVSMFCLYLLGTMPQILSAHDGVANEWHKLQAEQMAEAGLTFALRDWLADPLYFTGDIYDLSMGSVRVTATEESTGVVKFIVYSTCETIYQDRITAFYDTELADWVDWKR